jgi:multidrug efflux pump subunit AcrA (membrane-fusion protein)
MPEELIGEFRFRRAAARNRLRWIGAAITAAAVIAAAWYVFTPGAAERPPTEHASEATAPSAARHVPRIFAGGIVEGAQREIGLHFEIPGRLKGVYVNEGDLVQAGDVLAELDTELQEVRLAEAQIQHKIALAERDRLLAQRKLVSPEPPVRELTFSPERARPPVAAGRGEAEGARSQSDRAAAVSPIIRIGADQIVVEVSPEELTVADARVALADSAIRRERILLDRAWLRAPAQGLIVRVAAEPGELVAPGDGRSLFTFVNNEYVRVRAFVEEFDALRVAPGQKVTITAPGTPDRPIEGIVAHCSPQVRPKSHFHLKPGERLDVRVREVLIDVEAAPDLLIGLPVEVWIELR